MPDLVTGAAAADWNFIPEFGGPMTPAICWPWTGNRAAPGRGREFGNKKLHRKSKKTRPGVLSRAAPI